MPLTEAGATVLASGIAAGANMAGSVVKNRRSYKFTKMLMDKQQQINLQNWNLQNAYNSPSAQMARLRAASLNPNLIYANGGSFSGAGEIGTPSFNQFDYQDPISSTAQGVISGMSALANFNSVQAATENTKMATQLAELDKKLKSFELPWKDKFLYQQFMSENMRMLLNKATIDNLTVTTNLTKKEVDTYDAKLQNMFANDSVQRALGRAGIAEVQKRIEQIDHVIEKTDNETALLKLEYARAAIAKEVEQLTLEWQKGYSYVEKTDENGNVISSYHQRNIHRMLNNEIDKIEAEIFGQKLSNVSNPIKDIALGVAGVGAMLSRNNKFKKKR